MQTVRPPDASQGSGMVVDSQAVVRNNTLHPDPTKGTIDRQLQPRIRPVNLTSTWPTHRGRRAAALPALVWVCSQFRTVWSHAWAPESTTTATTQDPCTALPGHALCSLTRHHEMLPVPIIWSRQVGHTQCNLPRLASLWLTMPFCVNGSFLGITAQPEVRKCLSSHTCSMGAHEA